MTSLAYCSSLHCYMHSVVQISPFNALCLGAFVGVSGVSVSDLVNICPECSSRTNPDVPLTRLFGVILTCGHLCLRSLQIESRLILNSLRSWGPNSCSNHIISFGHQRVSGVIITIAPPRGGGGGRYFSMFGCHIFSRILFGINNQWSVIKVLQ